MIDFSLSSHPEPDVSSGEGSRPTQIGLLMEKHFYVYLLTNHHQTVLYIGITNDLIKRIQHHKQKSCKGFTKKYNVTKLVYYGIYNDPLSAILREKEIKGWNRRKKIALIEKINPECDDLLNSLL